VTESTELDGVARRLLDEISENPGLKLPGLLERMRLAGTYSDEVVREVLWQLLASRQLRLTDDRELERAAG